MSLKPLLAMDLLVCVFLFCFVFASASSLYNFPQYISLKTEKKNSMRLIHRVHWSLIWPNFRFGSLHRLLCLLLNLESNQRVLFRLSWHIPEMETAGIFSRCLPCYGFKLKVKLMYSGSRSEIITFEILAFQRP